MKYALQIYGELRSFERCIPQVLKFLSYNINNFDVFLLIDRKGGKSHNPRNKNNYSLGNIDKLKNMLGKSKIKKLLFFDELENIKEIIKKEQDMEKEINQLWRGINQVYGGIANPPFVCNLLHRHYLLNNIRKAYQNENNIKYDYVVRTRFDFGTTYNKPFIFSKETTPVMCSDALIIGKPEFVDILCEATFNFPLIPKVIFDKNYQLRPEKYEQYKNWRGAKFWEKEWIFAPELNIRLELLEKNINFIEAWWLKPCNYGFKMIRHY